MGMSDYISCDNSLPDSLDGRQYGFQTFDLENQDYNYLISKEGELFLILHSSNELKKYGEKFYDGKRWLQKTNFTGAVEFGGEDENKKWHEYKAEFNDGKLKNIKNITPYWEKGED